MKTASFIGLLLLSFLLGGCSVTHTVSRSGVSGSGSLPKSGKIRLASREELEVSRIICGRDITSYIDSTGNRRNIATRDGSEIHETDRFLGGFLGFLAGGIAGGEIGYWTGRADAGEAEWSGLIVAGSTAVGIIAGIVAGTVTGACIGYRTNHEFVREPSQQDTLGILPITPAEEDTTVGSRRD